MTSLRLMHFVVRNMTVTLVAGLVTITCYTNYPCHLYLRWTNVEPQKHVNPVIVRGAVAGTYIDQCFVVYHDVEQNEPGDTTTHTFIVSPWPTCETRYFYFWGTVGGVLSPSASAIFSYHNVAPPPPTTFCYQMPRVPESGWAGASCNSQSYCFRPCATFTPSHLTLWLKKHPSYGQAFNVECIFWTAAASGQPIAFISPVLNLAIPLLGATWTEVRNAVTCPTLTMGVNYAFSLMLPRWPLGAAQYIIFRLGMNDTCPPPIPQAERCFRRLCSVGYSVPCNCTGKPWSWAAGNGFNYKLEGY